MQSAIPSNLNLGLTKPTTVPAYSRRVESIATNAQTFTEGGTANIVLDTSTPGSFLDPQQSLLQFDIELQNQNPYIDYVNLSASGMAAVIQDMRIICQGTPIEEIFDYNLMFEMFMDLGGHMQEEFKMYMENGWRAPVNPGETDLNFVKPPMIDREGIIMNPNPINMFGDTNTANTHWEEGLQTLDTNDTNKLKFGYFNGDTYVPTNEVGFINHPDPTLGVNYTKAKTFGYRDSGSRQPGTGVAPTNLSTFTSSKSFIYRIENKVNNSRNQLRMFYGVAPIGGSLPRTGLPIGAVCYWSNLSGLADGIVAPGVISSQTMYAVAAIGAGINAETCYMDVEIITDMDDNGGPLFSATASKIPARPNDTTVDVLQGMDISAENYFSDKKNSLVEGGPGFRTAALDQRFDGAWLVQSGFPSPTGIFLANSVVKQNNGNFIHLVENDSAKFYGTNAPGNIRTACWTNRIDNTYVTWPQTLRPEPLSKNESRMRMEGDMKKYRVQDYLQYLANVKNIPVGISSPISIINLDTALSHDVTTNTGSNSQRETSFANWNFEAVRNHFTSNSQHLTGASQSYKCTVTLPIFSGILGCWAEKQFPSMLISPGSFYIQIKFASAANAFQCAMDPCRRIHGTYRDYVPNCGLPNYYATEFNGQNIGSTKTILTLPPVGGNGLQTTRMAITPAGAKGYDYAWAGILTFSNDQNTIWNRYNILSEAYANPSLGDLNMKFGTSDKKFQLNDHLGFGEGYTTGNAKPQYVPRRTPWKCLADYWGFGPNCVKTQLENTNLDGVSIIGLRDSSVKTGDYGYVRERECCFGTYLPASTAQVRRTRTLFNKCPNISQYKADEPVRYFITNLKYVGIQTILPDEVTASIVKQAASSDISLHAQSVRTYKSLLSQSSSQNLILPVKVASANSMWVIFQNQHMVDNTHYCSLTRSCPLSLFQWTKSSTNCMVGSDTIPVVKSVLAQNAFQIQLRIGNELLPIQPMTCLNHIVTELLRSVHGLGDMNTELPLTAFIRNKRFEDNQSTKLEENIYNTLKSGDFCVPYIPIEALDDQTITNNPVFMDYHNAQQTDYENFLPNGTNPTAFNDRDRYILNEFLPPISKFLLGFDLDTFPGTNNVARSGRYLGNAPLTLQMTNVHAAATSSIRNETQDSYSATAVVLHDVRFSIMAGGQILSYY